MVTPIITETLFGFMYSYLILKLCYFVACHYVLGAPGLLFVSYQSGLQLRDVLLCSHDIAEHSEALLFSFGPR